jgi:hypothetical protein
MRIRIHNTVWFSLETLKKVPANLCNACIDTFSDFTKRKMLCSKLGCFLLGMTAGFLVFKIQPMLNDAAERSLKELGIYLASPQPSGPPTWKKESVSGRISCPFHPVFTTLAYLLSEWILSVPVLYIRID